MMNCMTSMQKFYALAWAILGFFILGVAEILTTSVWGILAPDFAAQNSDMLSFICWATITALYIGWSWTKRNKYEFIDKMCVCASAATGDRRAEHRMLRWQAELELRESWGDWIAQTGCGQSIEDIASFLANEYDVHLNELAEFRRIGAASKDLSDKQVNAVLRAVAVNVEIAYS